MGQRKKGSGLQCLEKLEGFSTGVFLVLSILAFAVLFGLSFLLSGENSLDIMEETVYIVRDSIWGNLLGIAIFLALGVGIVRCFRRYGTSWNRRYILAVILVGMTAVSVLWVWMSKTMPQADQKVVCDFAHAYNQGDYSSLARGGYVAKCPHQLGMITWIRVIFKLFGENNYHAFQYFSACMVPVLVYSGDRFVRKLVELKRKKCNPAVRKTSVVHVNTTQVDVIENVTAKYDGIAARKDADTAKDAKNQGEMSPTRFVTAEIFYLLLIVSCVPLYLYVPFVYGEVSSTAFAMLSAWMFLECLDRLTIRNGIGLALSAGAAVMLRQNTVILLIGYLLVAVIKWISTRKKQMLLAGCCILAGLLLFQGMLKVLYQKHRPEDAQAIPAILYVAMGIHESDLGAGWFDGYNFLTFEGEGCDREKAEAVAKADLKEFAYKIKTDPAYGVDFYFRKFVTQWSTPMYQGLSMNNCLEAERPRIAESVYFGRLRTVIDCWMNWYQLALYGGVLAMLLFSCSRFSWRRSKKSLDSYSLLIGIFGGILFTMLWEAKSRYVFPYLLLLIPYAAAGLADLMERLNGRIFPEKGNAEYERRNENKESSEESRTQKKSQLKNADVTENTERVQSTGDIQETLNITEDTEIMQSTQITEENEDGAVK